MINQEVITLPAGDYLIADPCYLLGDQKYDEWLGQERGELNIVGGLAMVSFYTEHGDGEYYDTRGRNFAVDSGTIAVIPVATVDTLEGDYIHAQTFFNDFECFYDNEKGVIHFDDVLILTNVEECEYCSEDIELDDELSHGYGLCCDEEDEDDESNSFFGMHVEVM